MRTDKRPVLANAPGVARLARLLLSGLLLSGLFLGPLLGAPAALAQGQAGAGPGKPLSPLLSYAATPVTGLPSRLIWSVAFDEQGRPWVGSNDGGAVLEDGEWQMLSPADGLPSDSVTAWLFEAGGVWVGTERGLSLLVDGAVARTYSWDDGMASSGVQDLALDAKGNLWAAHLAEGVSRFDGEQWQKFTTDDGLADNWVYSIALAASGDLWFGTGAGASRFDGETWQTFSTAEGLAGDWVADVAVAPNGNLWFATDGGVSQFDGANWTTHLAGRPARSLAISADGEVWAAGSGFVSVWDGETWRDVQPQYFAGQLLQALALAANGEVWVGSLEDGVTILTPQPAGDETNGQGGEAALWLGTGEGVMLLAGAEQQRFDTSDGLAAADVRAILIDSQGRKWFATSGGASQYDGAAWTSYYPSAQSISSNYVHTVAVDPQGRTWFAYGDRGLGVSVKDGDEWRQYTAADGLVDERVYSLAFGVDGRTYAGTGTSIFRLNEKRWVKLGAQYGAPAGKIETLAVAPTGELWAGFPGGVARYDGRDWITFGPGEGLEVGDVHAIAFDGEGAVWIGAAPSPQAAGNGGLFVYDGGEWTAFAMNRTPTVYSGPAADPLGDWVSGLAFDEAGSLWVGTLAHPLARPGFVHGGVSVYHGDVLGDVGWTVYTPDNGLPSEYVTALAVDANGDVWAGTQDGLSLFDGEGWTTYTTADGLPANTITALAPDATGGLWIATAGSGATLYNGETWEHLTTVGLADRDVRALAEDAEGSIWFATAGGVSRFDGEAWTAYTVFDGLASNDNSALAVDGSGAVWAGGAADPATGALLSRFDGEGWRTYTLGDSGLYSRVDALAVDGEGNAWAAAHYPNQFSSASALFVFDGEGWRQQAAGPGPLGDDQVHALAIDSEGAAWLGTDGSYGSAPLLVWDGTAWSSYPEVRAGAVFAITLASSGQGWLGTDIGLARLDMEPGELYVTYHPALRNIPVQAVALEPAPAGGTDGDEAGSGEAGSGEADGAAAAAGWQVHDELGSGFQLLAAGPGASLWAAADDRLLHVTGDMTQSIDLPASLAAAIAANGSVAFPTLTDLAVDAQDAPWLATDGQGLFTLAGGEWRQETAAEGLPGDSVARLAFDGADRLWGVFRTGEAYTVAYRAEDGWVDATPPGLGAAPRGLAATADAVWLAASGKAPLRWQNGAWEQVVENWHGSSFDTSVAASPDTVWFGNDAGWLRRGADSWQAPAGTIPAPFSLPAAVDTQGGVWGIVTPFCYWCRLPNLNENGAIYATLNGACRFTAADGLGGEPLDPAPYAFDPEPVRPDAVRDIVVAGDGVVWFITSGRLTSFTAQGPVCPAR